MTFHCVSPGMVVDVGMAADASGKTGASVEELLPLLRRLRSSCRLQRLRFAKGSVWFQCLAIARRPAATLFEGRPRMTA